ncbi:MAG: DUF2191 domain-containing protein [bacterium]
MKVTAILPDELIEEVKELSSGRNITEGLLIALSEWTALKKIKNLNSKVETNPLSFSDKFDASKNRERNRKR